MSEKTRGWITAWWVPLALFAGSFLLRLFRVEGARQWIEDTPLGGPAAELNARYGFMGPGPWTSQPSGNLVRYPFQLLFGDGLVGWRMANVLFGALTVLVVYFVARRLFRNYWIGLAAGLLMALEPFSILMSRSTDEDVIAAFFIALAVLCALRFIDKGLERDLAFTALALSAAIALRYYMALVWLVVVGTLVWSCRKELRDRWLSLVAYFVVLPPALVLLANLPWIARGHGFGEWLLMQGDLFRRFGAIDYASIHALAGPFRWVLGFPHVVVGGSIDASTGAMSASMSNPPVWWLMTPAAIACLWQAIRSRDARRIMGSAAFLVPLVFFLLVPRDVMLYSALAILPMGMVMAAWLLSLLKGRGRSLALVMLVVWCLYLYPAVSAVRIPLWPYLWLAGGS